MLSLITSSGEKIKINGCLYIPKLKTGQEIHITQRETVTLRSWDKKKSRGRLILTTVRDGMQHKIIVEKFPKGQHLYKILSIDPVPTI